MTERFFEEELTGNVGGQKSQERTSYEGVEDAKFVEIKEGLGEDEGQNEIEKNPVEKDKFFWLQTGQKDLMTLNVGDLTNLSEQQTVAAEDFAEMLHKIGLGAHRGGGGELSVDFTDMDSFPHLEEADKKELGYFNHAAAFLIKGNKEKEGGKLKIDIRNNLLEEGYKAKRDMAAKILTRAFAKNMRKSEKSKGEIEKAIADYEAAERAKIDARVRVAQFLKFGKEEKGDDRVVARTMLSGLKGNGIPKLMKNDFYREIFAMKGKKKETERLSEEAILDARALEEQMENYKAIGEFPTFRGKSAELLETIREQITQMRSKYGDVINKEKLPDYLK